jgi:hypothetical protein
MIPEKNDPRWIKLVKGDIEHDFKFVAAGLLMSVIKREYQSDGSDININKYVLRLYDFFQRFEQLLQDDISVLFSGAGGAAEGETDIIHKDSNMLLSVSEVKKLIQNGEVLIIAGDESALSQLPKGNWIGGTIPYFMSEAGGVSTATKIFVTRISDYIADFNVKFYDITRIDKMISDMPNHGFSFIIIPAQSKMHTYYAQNVPLNKNMFMNPIIGWIAGVDLNILDSVLPKVYNGKDLENSSDNAIVMHISLPADKIAHIGIINIFKPGEGDSIQFLEDGFSVKNCLVRSRITNFSDYLLENKINTKLPLVANYNGTRVNVSFQEVNHKDKTVSFYAPVFKGVAYKTAMPVEDYIVEFMNHVPQKRISPLFSCNCILNYLYSELEGKKIGSMTGPITFGEIAYQLLNQTLTYLEIRNKFS